MSAFASILNLYKFLSVKRKIQGFICLSFILGSAISESIVIFSLSNFLLILSGGLNVPENNINPLLFFLKLNNNSLFYVSVIFIIAICISTILRLFTAYLNAFYSAGISHDLSKAIYIKSLRTPYYKHINKNSSDLISLISTHLNQATETITYTLQLLTGLFATFSIVISLSTINLKILISIVFIFSLVYLILGFSVKKVLAKDSKIIAKSINKQINIAKESILNFKDVIIYNLFHSYTQSYVKTDFDLRYKRAKGSIIAQFPRYLIEGLGIIILTSFVLILQKTSLDQATIFSIIGSFALGAQKMFPSLQQIYNSWVRIKLSIRSLDLICLELEKPTNTYNLKNITNNKRIIKLNSIELSNVSFAYKYGKEVLKNISLKIQCGESLGIIGESGFGKSTLINIILGLLVPQKGYLKINGKIVNHKQFNGYATKKFSIGHVSQNYYLIDGSIKENICLGIKKEDIKKKILNEVIKISQLENLINSLEDGIETQIGENGINLSGGQRQRLAIARALYRKPSLLILDEATSSLDPKTEENLINGLDKLLNDIILVMISHKRSSLKKCTSILELKKNI